MYVVVVEQNTVDEIDREHLAGAEAPLADDILLIVVIDANF